METLVLMLTDVEGSTPLWQDEPDAMAAAMARHHEILHSAVAEHGGWRPPDQGEGDAVFAAFRSAADAVRAVVQSQRALGREPWPTSRALRVRVAVHVGEVRERDGNLFGVPVNRCARIRGLAAGGQSLLSAPAFELVRDRLPPGVTARDLGEHRLKDLRRAERIFQLDVEGLDTDFPPLRSLDLHRHNLPIQTSSFLGRERELADLVRLVDQQRLVTITGFGGMGKTRLALQVAAELLGGEPRTDVWFVDLSAVSDPFEVPARIAEAAGVQIGARDPSDALIDALRDGTTLLVLDNLEQILGCAAFVTRLLSVAAGVRVLATSREPLRVQGEHQYALPPLSTPDDATARAAVDAQTMSSYAAVQLFVQRATAVKAGFAVTDDNAPAVGAICRRLDGLPLALELAAARIKVMTPKALLARLDQALSVLSTNAQDLPERHRTLRAAIAWSVDGLAGEERELLDALAVLPAPADYDMVAALCPDGLDVLSVLEQLIDKSLVRTVDAGDDDIRYGLLVSIRDYVLAEADERAMGTVKDRHACYVARLLHTAFQDDGTEDVVVARELMHVRAAMTHRLEHGAAEALTQMVCNLGYAWVHAGNAREYLDFSSVALRWASDPRDRAQVHNVRAIAYRNLGSDDNARKEHALSIGEARRTDDALTRIRSLIWQIAEVTTQSEILTLSAELDAQIDAHEELPELERRWAASERDFLVTRALQIVRPDEASAAARRMLGTDHDIWGRQRLALVFLDNGDVAAAVDISEPLEAPGDVLPAQAVALSGTRSEVLLAAGRVTDALDLARRAFETSSAVGQRLDEASMALSDAQAAVPDFEAALGTVDYALTRLTAAQPHAIAKFLWRRASLFRRLNRTPTRAADLQDAIRELPSETFRRGLPDLLGALVEVSARVQPDRPAAAARLIGFVDASGTQRPLPLAMDAVAAAVRAAVLPAYLDDYETGRGLDEAEALKIATG